MPFRDAIDENGIVLGVVGSQRQNLLIRSRLIPRTRSRAIWESSGRSKGETDGRCDSWPAVGALPNLRASTQPNESQSVQPL